MLAADARRLEAAERRRGVDETPRVDVDRPGAQQTGEPVGVGDVARPHAGGQAVLAVVGPAGDLLERLVGLRDEDRAEDLLAHDPRGVVGRGEERRLDVVAAGVGGDRISAAARDQLGLRAADLDVAADALVLLGGDERPDERLGIEAGARRSLARLFGQRADDVVEQLLGDEESRRRVARLAAVVVDAGEGALDRALDVGVGQHDVGRLAAELERHALEVAPRARADLAADRGRPREGDLVHARVCDERGAGLAVAGDDVEHAGRDARLEGELAEAQRGERGLLGGLEDGGAARGERGTDLPGRHQQREVPGDDLAADADRLGLRVAEHVAPGDRDDAALDLRRPAGEVLEVADRLGDVDGARELDRLAVVQRLQLGELVGVRVEQPGQRGDPPAAVGGAHLAPVRALLERAPRGPDGAVDVLRPGVADGRQALAGRRVGRVEGPPAGGGAALAVDEQLVDVGGEELADGVGDLGGGHGAVSWMVDSAAVVPGWPWIADAGRRPPDRHSTWRTGRSGGWRSGAARRGQPGARVVESAIRG